MQYQTTSTQFEQSSHNRQPTLRKAQTLPTAEPIYNALTPENGLHFMSL